MSFLGFYDAGEQVRLWSEFVDLSGSAVIPLNPNVKVYKNSVNILNANLVQKSTGSNLFYYDYTIPLNESEGNFLVVYSGDIDSIIVESNDIFKVDKIKSVVKENRLGNQRILFYEATVSDPIRNVAIGVLDKQVIETKLDSDLDWSTPKSSKTLWFWYDTMGDINPVRVGEDG